MDFHGEQVDSRDSQLLAKGDLAALEALYRQRLAHDRWDVRTAFQLATVLALIGGPNEIDEARRLFDRCTGQDWNKALCLNNRGVVQARLGQAQAALQSLIEACQEDPSFGPAAYNLGILYERLTADGSIVKVLEVVKLAPKAQADPIRELFGKASRGRWPEVRDPKPPRLQPDRETVPQSPVLRPQPAPESAPPSLLRPLLLWLDDLQPGFGFGPEQRVEDIEAGHRHLQEGKLRLREGKLEAAMASFDAAQAANPGLSPEILPLRREAELAHLRSLREKANEHSRDGRPEEARQARETLLTRHANVRDHDVARAFIEAEIMDLAETIRSQPEELDWVWLQQLISDARERVEELEATEPKPYTEVSEAADVAEASSESGEVTSAPGPAEPEPDTAESQEAEGDSVEESEPPEPSILDGAGASAVFEPLSNRELARRLRQACREAWWRQIRKLMQMGRYDGAIELVSFPSIEWFAGTVLERWRREVCRHQAGALAAEALQARGQGELAEEKNLLRQALKAAREAGDSLLQDRLEERLKEAEDRKTEDPRLEKIRELLDLGHFMEAFEESSQALNEKPADRAARTLRETATDKLLIEAAEALRAGRWQDSEARAGMILSEIPDQREALDVHRKSLAEQVRQMIGEARAVLVRHPAKAKKLAKAALALAPDSVEAQELLRQIEEKAKKLPKKQADSYRQAWLSFVDAREGHDTATALAHFLTLYELAPREPDTVEALHWVREVGLPTLERDVSTWADEARAKLQDPVTRYSQLWPKDTAARELRKLLTLYQSPYEKKRRKKIQDAKKRADSALGDSLPADALKAVAEVLEHADATSRVELEALRDRAREQMSVRLGHLTQRDDGEAYGEADKLLRACEPWDPEFTRRKRDEVAGWKRRIDGEQQLEKQIRTLVNEVREAKSQPARAWGLLDAGVKSLPRAAVLNAPALRQVLSEAAEEVWQDLGGGRRWWLHLSGRDRIRRELGAGGSES